MSIMRSLLIVGLAIPFSVSYCFVAMACGQEVETQLDPPELQCVLRDDFSSDTRELYRIEGPSQWNAGRLELLQGVLLERAIPCGPHGKLELEVEERGAFQLRVRLAREDAPIVAVELSRDTAEETGELKIEIVREEPREQLRSATVPGQAKLRIEIEYRWGLVQLWLNGKLAASCQADPVDALEWHETEASVRSFGLVMIRGRATITELAFDATPPLTVARTPTPAQRDELTRLQQSLVTAFEEGNDDETARVGRQLLRKRQEYLPAWHPDIGQSLSDQALVESRITDGTTVQQQYLSAIDVFKRTLGADHADFGSVANSLANYYVATGRYGNAEPLYVDAIRVQAGLVGEAHPDYASSLHRLGWLYYLQGRYGQAIGLYNRALEIRQATVGREHSDYGQSLNDLGLLYWRCRELDQAASLLGQAAQIYRERRGENSLDYGTSLCNLGHVFTAMGDLEAAEKHYLRALEIRGSVLGEDNTQYGQALSSLAIVYRRSGEYDRAEKAGRRALEIRKRALGVQHPDYAQSLNNLALLYSDMGDFGQAEEMHREALRIKRETLGDAHPAYAESLNNLGLLFSSMGRVGEAEQLLREALAIKKARFGGGNLSYALSLTNLAILYLDDTRRHPDAQVCLEEALAVFSSQLGPWHPSTIEVKNCLAAINSARGEFEAAETTYREILENSRLSLGDEHPRIAVYLCNLAQLLHEQGNYADADELYGKALSIQRTSLNNSSVVQSERQQVRQQASLRVYLDRRIVNALRWEDAVDAALQDLWQWKGAVTMRQRAYREVAGNPALAPLFQSLQTTTRRISTLLDNTPTPPVSADENLQRQYSQLRSDWEQRLAQLVSRRESLEQQIADASQRFRQIQRPLEVQQVKALLPPTAALVDFLEIQGSGPVSGSEEEGGTRFCAFVVRPNGPTKLLDLGDAAVLGSAVEKFRAALAEPSSTEELEQWGRALRRQLWEPIESSLDGIDTVILSPDTFLGTLPFAALPGKDAGSFLLEEYQIGMLPMAGLLSAILAQNQGPATNSLLLIGDVDYGAPGEVDSDTPKSGVVDTTKTIGGKGPEPPRDAFARLPGFRTEMDAISRLFQEHWPDQRLVRLTGTDATESTALQFAADVRVLHIITHGWFESPKPRSQAANSGSGLLIAGPLADPNSRIYLPSLMSGLAFAGANRGKMSGDDGNDGILYATEIEAAMLQDLDLVVLSACETGLGAVAGGEGLTGLQRAFHMAGARSVVASLWKVDDDATVMLMSEFYRNLWERRMSKLAALRAAQLTMLNTYRLSSEEATSESRKKGVPLGRLVDSPQPLPGRLSPHYWAAFQLSGDWQ